MATGENERVVDTKATRAAPLRLAAGRPPLPREHGAWLILYLPIVPGLVLAWPVRWVPVLLLVTCVTGLFLARHVGALLLRQRGQQSRTRQRRWLACYMAMAAAGGLPLVVVFRYVALLPLVVIAASLFAVHSALQRGPGGKRLDRSQWGEMLAVAALTLTAPAAYVVAGGTDRAAAWCLWTVCILYFSSGVFYVKMLLAAAKVKGAFSARTQWRVARDNLLYHVLMVVVLLFAFAHLSEHTATLAALAFAPVIVRGLWSAATLSNKLPSLKRVGLVETLYAIWFIVSFSAALRA